jgi:uncharacterized protein
MFDFVAHASPAAFLERGEAWLKSREAEHNLHLSLAYACRETGEVEAGALFGTVEADGEVVGCVIRTPPHKLLVTDLPLSAAPAVISVVSGLYDSLPAVLGRPDVAQALADAWVAVRGGVSRVGMGQGLYRLDTVIPVSGVSGHMRHATEGDFETLVLWGAGFGRDVGEQFTLPADTVRSLMDQAAMFVWHDRDVLSMTVAQGLTGEGCRIGYVYTPPELRGRGYASALVAAVSQHMLDEIASFCVLYTDLSNPTSNSIYQKVGYNRIAELVDVDIEPAS